MKKWGIVLLAWYFLLGGPVGDWGQRFYTQVGPFEIETDCDDARKWVENDPVNSGKKRVGDTRAYKCWEKKEK